MQLPALANVASYNALDARSKTHSVQDHRVLPTAENALPQGLDRHGVSIQNPILNKPR